MQNTGQSDKLAVSQIILCHEDTLIRCKRFIDHIQVRQQKTLRQKTVSIGHILTQITGGRSDNIILINTVRCKPFNLIRIVTLFRFPFFIQNIRRSYACIPLIIYQTIQIFVLIKNPLSSALCGQTVIFSRHTSLIEFIADQQIIGIPDRSSNDKIRQCAITSVIPARYMIVAGYC